jgi:catechol 2,3-dioxygenase
MSLQMGPVTLTVADLDRSTAFYAHAVGLDVLARGRGSAVLGAPGGTGVLHLEEVPGAPPADGYPGLFHFALVVPRRVDLATYVAHVARQRIPLVGVADHAVSEAVYLQDPDHHGIEVYWDRPRPEWEGRVEELMTTLPLDVDGLLGELADPASARFDGLAADTRMGHVHLRVNDVPRSIAFYRDVLGLDLMVQLGGQAAFLAADGYHHHIGANTWETSRRVPPPEGTAGLREVSVLLPDAATRDAVVRRAADAGQEPSDAAGDGAIRIQDPSGSTLALGTVTETTTPAGAAA